MANKRRPTRNISLTPQMDQFIDRLVREGQYQSASEVVREGMRLVRSKHDTDRAKIEQGWRSAERGDLIDSERVFAELHRLNAADARRGRRRLSA